MPSHLRVLPIVGIIYTLVAGNQPLLGLDLQGGVSVVYEADDRAPATRRSTRRSRSFVSRVDALGVAEPEISRQGQTIVVDLPGVDEQQRALDLVGQTAELRFRPVIADLGPRSTRSCSRTCRIRSTDRHHRRGRHHDHDDRRPGTDEQGLARNAAADATRRRGYRRRPPGDHRDRPETATDTTTDATDDTTVVEPPPVELTPEHQAIADAVAEACGIDGTTAPEDDLAGELRGPRRRRAGTGTASARPAHRRFARVGRRSASTTSAAWLVSPVFKDGCRRHRQVQRQRRRSASSVGGFDPNVCPRPPKRPAGHRARPQGHLGPEHQRSQLPA